MLTTISLCKAYLPLGMALEGEIIYSSGAPVAVQCLHLKKYRHKLKFFFMLCLLDFFYYLDFVHASFKIDNG